MTSPAEPVTTEVKTDLANAAAAKDASQKTASVNGTASAAAAVALAAATLLGAKDMPAKARQKAGPTTSKHSTKQSTKQSTKHQTKPPTTQKAVAIAPKAEAEAVKKETPAPADTRPPPSLPAVGENDVVFVDGQAFNGRGYQVCGVANQRGRRCGRIGTCPFHSGDKSAKKSAKQLKTASRLTLKRPRPPALLEPQEETKVAKTTPDGVARPLTPASASTPPLPPPLTNGKRAPAKASGKHAQSVIRQVQTPPQKSRFKRSWTPEEHRLFLQAMRKYGKGKWKEIAAEVKTRTANQCQSHAQKYFLRQAKSNDERKKKSIHDVTDVDLLSEAPISNAPSTDVPSSTPPPTTASKPVLLLPRRSTAVPLAPAPMPRPDGQPQPGRTGPSKLTHRLAPVTLATSGSLTCAARAGRGMPAGTAGMSTVPVVFPMSSVGGMQYAPLVQPFLNSGNASGAAVVAPPPPAKLRVTVHENGKLKGGMALVLPDTLQEFFDVAKSKLGFNGSFLRVFTRSGGEITCLDEMCQDDMLWLSSGGDFLTPR